VPCIGSIEGAQSNRVVHSRLRSAAAFLLAISVAAIAIGDLESWSQAMACCAMADYECATLDGPDACCQTMGHTAASVTAAPPANPVALPALMLAVVPAIAVPPLEGFAWFLPSVTFKRPHDPPHLHPVPLLV
jgi:hypothetical protein